SRSYQDLTSLLSDFSSPRHHIRSLSQGAQCVELPDKPPPPLSPGMPRPAGDDQNPLWRKQSKRNSLPPDLDEGTNSGASNAAEDEPSSSPSSSQRHLRRVVSDKTAPSASGSPTTPRRTVGSFIRRRLRSSTAPEQDSDSPA